MTTLVLVVVVLIILVAVSLVTVWRAESRIAAIRHDVQELQSRLERSVLNAPDSLVGVQQCIRDLDARYELMKRSLMKVLVPIRSNAQDIAELDDDLARLQRLYEELKKGEFPPPSAAA